ESVDHSMSADNGIGQSGALLIILEAVLVAGHSLKAERVDRPQIRIHFGERLRIEEVADSVLGRKGKVVIAARTNAQIFIQLDFVDHFIAAGTLLKQTLRDVALLATLRPHCWFLENRHGCYARAAVAA